MRTIRELAGWGLLLVVQITPLVALAMLVAFVGSASLWLPLGALLLALAWPRLWLSARRLREPPEDEVAEADGRRPVVLLHRFARVSEPLFARLLLSPALARELRDALLERSLIARAIAAGPVLRLERPEPPATYGPVRAPFDDDWARTLDRHLRRAALAVIVADGSEANAREIERARALLGLARTAIVVPRSIPAERHAALLARFPFLPMLDARNRVVRFDADERAFVMPGLLLRDGESAPRPRAPAATVWLSVLAIVAGIVSAVAAPAVIADRLGLDTRNDSMWITLGAVVIVLGIAMAVLSRRALSLVPSNEAVMVTVAASPWLFAACGAAIIASEGDAAGALSLDAVGAAYSAPLLAAAAVILAVSSLVRRSSGRRAAFATFGAAALLPFAPIVASLAGTGAATDAFSLSLLSAAVGLGLSAWAASGEPLRANAPLPIGAAVAAALSAVAAGVVSEHAAWHDLLGAGVSIAPSMARDLSTFAKTWPFFALAGPIVVVLVAAQFRGRASRAAVGSVASLAPLVIVASLVVSVEGHARAALGNPSLAYGVQLLQLAEGTSLAPGFALPEGTYSGVAAYEPAAVALDREGLIVDGVRVAGPLELRAFAPSWTSALFAVRARAGDSLPLACGRSAPLADLRALVRAARSAGFSSIRFFVRSPDGAVHTVSVSIVDAPDDRRARAQVRASDVLVTSAHGLYQPMPDAYGAIDSGSLGALLATMRAADASHLTFYVGADDAPDATARLVHLAAIVAEHYGDVRLAER